MKSRVGKAVIIGVGLIGGSLGMTLRKTGFAAEVVGVDRCNETISHAIEMEAIQSGTTDLKEGVEDADLLIIATPISAIHNVASKISGHLKPGAIITDVCSTKAEIVGIMDKSLQEGVCFIGGHPMAGSEKTGVKAADPYLFENALYILTPSSLYEERSFNIVYDMVNAVGARPLIMTPEEHDRIVACVSHLPHLIAAALVSVAMEEDKINKNVLPLAAGGFRDTTRIAGGDPGLWRDIFFSNKDELLRMIKLFEETLKNFRMLLERDLGDELKTLLYDIKRTRETIPAKTKGFFSPIFEIVVMVHDRPGAISDVTSLLADAGLNIKDIEILHLREGEGGTLRLGFATEDDAEGATRILESRSFTVRRRL